MLFFLVLGLLLGALTVIFALQNFITVSVNFLAWQTDGSLALILLLAMLSGVLICALLSIPEVIKTHMAFAKIKKINKQLEEENANLKKIAADAAATASAVAQSSVF